MKTLNLLFLYGGDIESVQSQIETVLPPRVDSDKLEDDSSPTGGDIDKSDTVMGQEHKLKWKINLNESIDKMRMFILYSSIMPHDSFDARDQLDLFHRFVWFAYNKNNGATADIFNDIDRDSWTSLVEEFDDYNDSGKLSNENGTISFMDRWMEVHGIMKYFDVLNVDELVRQKLSSDENDTRDILEIPTLSNFRTSLDQLLALTISTYQYNGGMTQCLPFHVNYVNSIGKGHYIQSRNKSNVSSPFIWRHNAESSASNLSASPNGPTMEMLKKNLNASMAILESIKAQEKSSTTDLFSESPMLLHEMAILCKNIYLHSKLSAQQSDNRLGLTSSDITDVQSHWATMLGTIDHSNHYKIGIYHDILRSQLVIPILSCIRENLLLSKREISSRTNVAVDKCIHRCISKIISDTNSHAIDNSKIRDDLRYGILGFLNDNDVYSKFALSEKSDIQSHLKNHTSKLRNMIGPLEDRIVHVLESYAKNIHIKSQSSTKLMAGCNAFSLYLQLHGIDPMKLDDRRRNMCIKGLLRACGGGGNSSSLSMLNMSGGYTLHKQERIKKTLNPISAESSVLSKIIGEKHATLRHTSIGSIGALKSNVNIGLAIKNIMKNSKKYMGLESSSSTKNVKFIFMPEIRENGMLVLSAEAFVLDRHFYSFFLNYPSRMMTVIEEGFLNRFNVNSELFSFDESKPVNRSISKKHIKNVSKHELMEYLTTTKAIFDDTRKKLGESSESQKKLLRMKNTSMNVAELFVLHNNIENIFESSLFTLNVVLDTWNLVVGECYRRYRLSHPTESMRMEKLLHDQSEHRYLNKILSSHSNALMIATDESTQYDGDDDNFVFDDITLDDITFDDDIELMDDMTNVFGIIENAVAFERKLHVSSTIEKHGGIMPKFQLIYTMNRLSLYNDFFNEFAGMCNMLYKYVPQDVTNPLDLGKMNVFEKKTLIHDFIAHKNMNDLFLSQPFQISHGTKSDTMLYEMNKIRQSTENIIHTESNNMLPLDQVSISFRCHYILFALRHVRYYHVYQYLFSELNLMLRGLDAYLGILVEFYCATYSSDTLANDQYANPIVKLINSLEGPEEDVANIKKMFSIIFHNNKNQTKIEDDTLDVIKRVSEKIGHDKNNILHVTAFNCIFNILSTHVSMLYKNAQSGMQQQNDVFDAHEFINCLFDPSMANTDARQVADQRIAFSMSIIMLLLKVSKLRMENEREYEVSRKKHKELYDSIQISSSTFSTANDIDALYAHFSRDNTYFKDHLEDSAFDDILNRK